jgi:phosphoribosylpyrophosphate synthetase
MQFDRPPRTPWHDFPDVVILADEGATKRHPAYAPAKRGDVAAARKLVESLVNEPTVRKIARAIPRRDAVLAAVHAIEAEGINRIPTVLAQVLAEHVGLVAEASLVQINRVGHTGASGYRRLAFPALFDGDVEAGRAYVLVDDFVGQGGTLANLKGFIESKGGLAVLAVTLTGKAYSAKLAPSEETLRALRQKHGPDLQTWWESTFGYRFDHLTESEARYVARADSAQLVRDRLVAARQEGNA